MHQISEGTYLIRTPIDLRNACVKASVLLISSENISLPAIEVNGVSAPSACAIPCQQAIKFCTKLK